MFVAIISKVKGGWVGDDRGSGRSKGHEEGSGEG